MVTMGILRSMQILSSRSFALTLLRYQGVEEIKTTSMCAVFHMMCNA